MPPNPRWGSVRVIPGAPQGGPQTIHRKSTKLESVTTTTPAPTRLTRPDGSPVRALVVDDEASLGDLLRMALRYEGWDVQTAANGQDALALARTFSPDVIVLDVMMPDLDGVQVLQRLRQGGNDVPVLFLTAKDAVDDRVAGLTAGGDDYVTKPFSLDEVIARLRGLLRRSARIVSAATDPEIRVGDLVLNEETYEVSRAGEPITLTATEFELLRYLMRNPRRVLSKAQILDRVWSYDFGGRSSIVEIYISYLRKKVDEGRDAMIHTVRGVGYTIKPSAPEPAA
jgi:two-component system OmpR family response regulator